MNKENIAAIMRAGDHIKMGSMSKESLVELAGIARASNVRLEIVGRMSAESLADIARAGGGYVTFDISG
jgi:hypothetical protein